MPGMSSLVHVLLYFMYVLYVHVSTNMCVLVPMGSKSQPLLAEESGPVPVVA